jgi:diguanylate cyclase (GGDEF)-like protein
VKARPFFGSLAGRIVGLFLGLLLAVQLLGFISIRQSIDRNARTQLTADLMRGQRVFARLLEQRVDTQRQAALLLAADFGFRSAAQSGDEATLRSALENQAARIGAQASAWVDLSGEPRAYGERYVPVLRRALPALAASTARAEAGDARKSVGTALYLVDGRAMEFVLVPVKAPLRIGWVAMGFTLGPELAQDLYALAGMHMALLAQTPGEAVQIVLSDRDSGPSEELLAPLTRAAVGWSEIPLGGDTVEAYRVDLPDEGGGQFSVALFRSIDEAVAPYRSLQAALIAITLLGVAVFALGSVLTARRVTQPVRQLLEASRRLGQGDFLTPVPQSGRDDELGELGLAFDTMRLGLASRTEQIRQLAYADRLTGLPNRARFEELLAASFSEQSAVAVLILNLDRLERVNQLLGRARGDQLLCVAADRLRALSRRLQLLPQVGEVTLARLGGDEFVLLLPGFRLDRAQWVVQEVVRSFERPVPLEGSMVDLSAGIGLALFPDHADRPDALMSRALLAMTEAKRRKAGCMVYEPAIDAGSTQTLSLLGELRRALREHELRLYLQPKLRVSDGTLAGAEALVRWQHPERGLVPPIAFIPFAEETGFIHELTLWVVEEAAAVWAKLRAGGLEMRLSVNLSAHDLMKPDLLDRLNLHVQRQQMPASAMTLEITESAIAADPRRALQSLQALKSAGYKLAIDDFGAGYTSLGQLTDLPVNELKIDMLFVRSMDREPDKAAMVRFIIALAHDRRLKVVAEGVENAAILSLLAAFECDEAQGYHIAKPMPAPDLLSWAAERWPSAAEDSPHVA